MIKIFLGELYLTLSRLRLKFYVLITFYVYPLRLPFAEFADYPLRQQTNQTKNQKEKIFEEKRLRYESLSSSGHLSWFARASQMIDDK